jgi:hypothetical protein
MGSRGEKPPLTEPRIVPCIFCTDVRVEVRDAHVRLVAIDEISVGANGPECRIVARLALTPETARALIRDLRRSLQKGSH